MSPPPDAQATPLAPPWERGADALLRDAESRVRVLDGCTPIYNQYVIRAERRDELRDFLSGNGIGCAIYYPRSLHEQSCFSSLGYKTGDFPESERASHETLSLPVYPELPEDEQQFVIEKIREFYAS